MSISISKSTTVVVTKMGGSFILKSTEKSNIISLEGTDWTDGKQCELIIKKEEAKYLIEALEVLINEP